MASINTNGESKIEVLKHRMQEAIRRKNKSIIELEQKIYEVETEVSKLDRELKWFEGYLSRLRRKREFEETNCFKEILKIHKEILELSKELGRK